MLLPQLAGQLMDLQEVAPISASVLCNNLPDLPGADACEDPLEGQAGKAVVDVDGDLLRAEPVIFGVME